MLKFHDLEVAGCTSAGEEALCLQIVVPPELREAFSGAAGQHVVLKADIDGEEVRRSYSLVSSPGEFPLRIGVRLHADGRMSSYLSRLTPGARLSVMPPLGSFASQCQGPAKRRYAAFAAGCGITPVLALVRAKLAEEPGCRWTVFYGNRSAGRAMFLDELLGLKDRYLGRLALHFVMSREPSEAEMFNGRIDAAKVEASAGKLFDPAATDEFFLCGPGDMIAAVGAALGKLGVAPDRIHSEHFTVESVAAADRDGEPPPRTGGAAEIIVIMDGRRRSFTMSPDDESILDAALDSGIDLPYSCCAGVCSTCRTRVVEGAAEMAENFSLEDWEIENGYVLACQSRPTSSELVLDYDDV
ncbi:MAG TPA: 2Fe-2S iron-sulfur cluster-binding protein [Pseudomonadales bacterium]